MSTRDLAKRQILAWTGGLRRTLRLLMFNKPPDDAEAAGPGNTLSNKGAGKRDPIGAAVRPA